VLIYAHDLDAGMKHDRAAAIISDLWEKESGVISVQVLQNSTLVQRGRSPTL